MKGRSCIVPSVEFVCSMIAVSLSAMMAIMSSLIVSVYAKDVGYLGGYSEFPSAGHVDRVN
jgi:hypothetical protein